jgi:DNA replication licensing factor MCM5
LQGIYVEDRSKANEKKKNGGSTIPITVRQLEAVIRLSESLTKMKLGNEVTKDEVEEAHYLFEISTMKTIEGKEFGL